MGLNRTQKEVELEISNILQSGDIAEISRISGIGYSYIDQQFNPNDQRQSSIYGFLRVICALDEVSPERGEKVWRLVEKIRELSKTKQAKTLEIVRELTKSHKEFWDVLDGHILSKSLYEQLGEVAEAIEQLAVLKEAIIAEINQEKETFDSSRTRIKVS